VGEIVAETGLRVGSLSGGQPGWLFRQLRKRLVTKDGGYLPGMGIHEAGGARMGSDPATSVLDRNNQLWDARNVYVTDASSFTSGGCQNNTLTIMALTVRACAHAVRAAPG
jgi:choline dehydrogenase-like flavoprotein